MSTDVLYPLLVGAGCLLVAVVVHLLTRPKPSADDIRLPDTGTSPSGPRSPRAAELGLWHQHHERAVLDFLDLHDPAPQHDLDTDAVADAMGTAIDEHPAPDMQAELAALRAAAMAVADARDRRDPDAADRHHEVYVTYRDAWLERLWQFPVDHHRLSETRSRVPHP